MITISFVGDSGVGKTTLLTLVIAELARRGVRVAAWKHSKEFNDPDPPGKDSARLRAAGASRVVLSSPDRTVAFWDHPAGEPSFEARLQFFAGADVVLVESFAAAGLPVIEVLRSALPRRSSRFAGDGRLRAIVSDFRPEGTEGVPIFALEDAEGIARFILNLRANVT